MSEVRLFDPHRLILQEFNWEHAPTRSTISFANGLNIIYGKTQAERTITLRLIRYALGGTAERIDEQIMHASEEVTLKFLVNEERIRVVRSCQHPEAQFEIHDGSGRHMFSRREMSEFLIDKLSLPKIYLPTNRADGTRAENLVSFSDFARTFVIDRDISYSGIMAGVYDRNRVETVKAMMGLTTPEVAEVENRIRNYSAQISDLKQSIVSIQGFLNTLNVPTLIEIEAQRQRLSTNLAAISEQEEILRSATRTRIGQQPLSGNTIDYNTLRTELLAKRAELNDKEREIQNLSRQITEKSELQTILESEAERIERHISSHHVVSTFLFTQCPRCEQSITQDMLNREKEDHCMLCGRDLKIDKNQTSAWEKALRDTRQTITEVTSLITDYKERTATLHKEIDTLNLRITQIGNGLSQQALEYIAPIVEKIQLNSLERIGIERELSQLDYQQRQRELAIHFEQVDLPERQSELEGLQQKLSLLRAEVGKISDYNNAFLSHFRKFLQSVDLEQRIESVEWDETSQLPKINGQPYKIMIGFDMVVTVLAFHYALLAMGIRQPVIKTGHPKLLVVDELEQQKMGKERYHQILNLFAQLNIENKNASQIIIATDIKDIPQELEQYAYGI